MVGFEGGRPGAKALFQSHRCHDGAIAVYYEHRRLHVEFTTPPRQCVFRPVT